MPFPIFYVGGQAGDPGEPTFFKMDLVGNGSQTAWTVNHNLDSGDIQGRLRSPEVGTTFTEGQDFDVESANIDIVDLNSVTVTINPAIPNGETWKLTVWATDKLLSGTTGGVGVSDHGALTGLADDDHSQYALANGTRGAFEPAGTVTAHNNLIDAHLIIPVYPSITSGSVSLNLNTSKLFSIVLNADITSLSIGNWNSGAVDECSIFLGFSGSQRTITWPSSWFWLNGTAMTTPMSTNPVVKLELMSYDGGTTVYVKGENYKQIASASVPSAITNLTAIAGDTEISLIWTAPSNGGSAITSYTVQRSVSGGAYSTISSPTSASFTNTGLTNGTAYSYRVYANNAIGASLVSNIATATPVSSAPSGYITPGPRAFTYGTQPAPTGGGITRTVTPANLQATINIANPGDVIVVTDGTYTGNINITNRSGNSSNPITIWSQNPLGAKFNMTGTGFTDGWWIYGNSSYWIIHGLEVYGTVHPQAPIRIRGEANNIIWENCYLHTGTNATTPESTVFVIDDTLNYITFRRCEVRGTMHATQGHGLRCWRVQNITVEDCTLSRTKNNLLEFQNARNLTIRYNHFSKAFRGMYHFAIDPGSGLGWDKGFQDNHHFDYNRAEFMGEWNPSYEGQNIIQYQNSAGANCRIRGNISLRPLPNASPYSDSEDHINMGRSGGVSGSPFLIEHNRLRGGGPSGTGTGIITDGGDDYIWIQDNTLDRTGQVGIGVAGGNNIIVRRNKVYSPAITFTVTNQGTNVGVYAWVSSLGASAGCSNITIQGNRVYWKYGNAAVGDAAIGADNPYWDGGNCGTINWANGNVWMDTSIGPSIFDEPIPAP